jgi:hypothetical protein
MVKVKLRTKNISTYDLPEEYLRIEFPEIYNAVKKERRPVLIGFH